MNKLLTFPINISLFIEYGTAFLDNIANSRDTSQNL